jgi:hypothetical protein
VVLLPFLIQEQTTNHLPNIVQRCGHPSFAIINSDVWFLFYSTIPEQGRGIHQEKIPGIECLCTMGGVSLHITNSTQPLSKIINPYLAHRTS